MLLSKLLSDPIIFVPEPIDTGKMILEQQETIRKLNEIKIELDKLKYVKTIEPPKLPEWVTNEVKKIPGVQYMEVTPPGADVDWSGSYGIVKNQSDTINLNLIDTIKELNAKLQHIIDKATNIWSYVTNPGKIFHLIWQITVNHSYVVCIILTFGGLVCGLIGWKKGYKVAIGSTFAYVAIQLFNILFGG